MVTLKPISVQQTEYGTAHFKKDLKDIQEIALDGQYTGEQIINRLRGLTTNNIQEGAYFTIGGKRYYMNLSIIKEE